MRQLFGEVRVWWCGSLCQHAAREKVRAEGAPVTGTLSAFAMDSRQVLDLRANLNKNREAYLCEQSLPRGFGGVTCSFTSLFF